MTRRRKFSTSEHPGRPWGRVLLLGLAALWVLSSMAVQQHAITLAFTLGAMGSRLWSARYDPLWR